MFKNDKKFAEIRGFRMAYIERGQGPTLVFVHGNPTSSFLWRHILLPLSERYHCLAPDLIGMGDSDKLPERGPGAYSFTTQQAFLEAWFEAVLPREPVVLVVHDWGATLALAWARRHPERVRGIVYMEAVLGSLPLAEFPPAAREFFAAIRSEAGEALVLEQNVFVERMVSPESTLRPMTEADADEYRRPFREPGEARRPTLSWPRLLPFDGEPREISELTDQLRAFMATSDIPKLFINAEPGRTLVGPLREECRSFRNQREVTVPGLHYPQEDSPMEIVTALADFLPGLDGVAP